PQHTPPSHTTTLSLHDALPISHSKIRLALRLVFSWATRGQSPGPGLALIPNLPGAQPALPISGDKRQLVVFRRSSLLSCLVLRSDRKSTRLNSSHVAISYAVFC